LKKKVGIGPVGAAEIVKLVEGHHYQIACKKYFDLTHPNNKWEDSGTMHPNTYFRESNKYWDERNPKDEKVKEEKDKGAKEGAKEEASLSKSKQLAE
jgi:hypothetical protein